MCDSNKFGISIVKYPGECVPSSVFFDYKDPILTYYTDEKKCMQEYTYNIITENNATDNDNTKFVKINEPTDSDDCSGTIDFYDYANEHLKTYKRFLCDKLPNKTHANDYIKEICETAEASSSDTDNITSNESWSWNPRGTSDILFTYEQWETYKKDLNNDSREKQLKYDKKLQYNSKKFEIYSLLIVIPILLFILKKY